MVNSTSMTESKNHGLLGFAFALVMMSAIAVLPALGVPQSAKDDQSIKAMPELVGTRYCYADAETYSVWLKLRVRYVNRAEKTVILDKEIGKAYYRGKVAKNLEDLAAGKYESNAVIDWFFTDKEKLPDRPSIGSPGAEFAVLTPDDRFESEINTGVVAQYENPKNFAGTIRSGTHVFQMELSAWNHPGEASVFAESWRKFGELVTGVIKTEPLEIRIPSDPKVEKNCN
jgi:hypothetical protein